MELEKSTVLQIIGCLMKDPMILSQVDKYNLIPSDFPAGLERTLFIAINNLQQNGAEKISIVDIDNLLSEHPASYKFFNECGGIDYLNDAEELAQVENFSYYYTKLKKYNVLKDLKLLGFNINKIYPENNLIDANAEEKIKKFEEMKISDIFDVIRADFAQIEDKYYKNANTETVRANYGITELIESFKKEPEIGINLQGDILNTVSRGARKGKFYLRSGSTGTGKTRNMIGDACTIAYPAFYDEKKMEWVSNGGCEKVLYVGTEQKPDEIQTMILSFLTGINEEKILRGMFNSGEEKIIQQALYIMNEYQDNFIICQVPDPNLEQVRACIRKNCLIYGTENVFYDYIFSSPALFKEFNGVKLREDNALALLSNLLKDLAVELNVFMMSATQLNANNDEKEGIKNQNRLRGSKAIADKIDMGMIISRISQEELRTLDSLIKNTGIIPNLVTDVYKLRRGRYNNVRIWSYIDMGTCRKKDLFITDETFKAIENFQITKISFSYSYLEEEKNLLNILNDGIEKKKEERSTVISFNDYL